MAVRNFYATIRNHVSGKPVSTGPHHATEGFTVTIEQRDMGEPMTALTVEGRYVNNTPNGEAATLRLNVFDHNGRVIHTFDTTR